MVSIKIALLTVLGAAAGGGSEPPDFRFQISDCRLWALRAAKAALAVPNSLAAGLHGIFKQALSAGPEEVKPFSKRSLKYLLTVPMLCDIDRPAMHNVNGDSRNS